MKLKPVISPNLPIRLVRELICPALNTWYIREVVKGCLHVQNPNPAGHYIQWPDFMNEWEDGQLGVEVSFSKLSARFDRSGKDFEDARERIEQKYKETIGDNLPKGRSCWLFVGSQTDKEIEGPDGVARTLQERGYVEVLGLAEPDELLDRPAVAFPLKPAQLLWFVSNPAGTQQ